MDPRVQYTLEVLIGSHSPARAPIIYGAICADAPTEPAVRIIPSGFFGSVYGTPPSLPDIPLKEIEGVPLLFGEPEVARRGSQLIVRADIVASAYFLLTRYEEWVRREVRDAHGRFPGKESLPYRAGFIDRPIVEEYAELLRKWAKEVGIHVPAPRRRFSVLLTHDVDTIGIKRNPIQPLRSLASGLLRRQPIGSALRNAAMALGFRPDPRDNLDDVVLLDRRLADRIELNRCQSLYFFMAGGRTPFDGSYNIRRFKARNAVRTVLNSGAGIGLHASYEAGQRPDLIARERANLEKVAGVPIYRNRHHFLTWREPEDAKRLSTAGITWDATLGYADVAGFRLGVCHPVPLFDPIERQPLEIEEHPLIVMDCTLSNEGYMNLDEQAAFDHVCKLADATLRHQGEFVVLWHNTVLAPTDPTYHSRLYPRILDYLAGLHQCDDQAVPVRHRASSP